MALPNFVLAADIREILGGLTGSELTETAATRAVISLTSNYPSDFPLSWEGSIERLEQPIIARVDTDGDLVNSEGDPLRLLARHEDLVPNLQWQVSITFPSQAIPPLANRALRHWWIDAGEDGDTIDLANTTPVVGVPGHGSSGGGGSGVIDGGEL